MSDAHLDGNAAGGELGGLFAFEPTSALLCCAGCGASGPLGANMLYATEMGTVLRCAGCASVLLAIVHLRGATRLQMQGIAWISVADPEPPVDA